MKRPDGTEIGNLRTRLGNTCTPIARNWKSRGRFSLGRVDGWVWRERVSLGGWRICVGGGEVWASRLRSWSFLGRRSMSGRRISMSWGHRWMWEMNLWSPEMDFRCPEVNFWSPEMHLRSQEIDFRSPEIDLWSLEMHLWSPEIDFWSLEMDFRSPEIDFRSREMDFRHGTMAFCKPIIDVDYRRIQDVDSILAKAKRKWAEDHGNLLQRT